MSLRVPRGGLVSWNGHTFRPNRSKLLAGWQLITQVNHAVIAGQLLSVDRYAGGVAPVDYVLPYEYKIAPPFGGTVNDVQIEFDAIIAAYGTSQVGTLVCLLQGDTAVTVSGIARLEEITETSGDPFNMVLNLKFYVEAGMS
jgi:hypothetical protein